MLDVSVFHILSHFAELSSLKLNVTEILFMQYPIIYRCLLASLDWLGIHHHSLLGAGGSLVPREVGFTALTGQRGKGQTSPSPEPMWGPASVMTCFFVDSNNFQISHFQFLLVRHQE